MKQAFRIADIRFTIESEQSLPWDPYLCAFFDPVPTEEASTHYLLQMTEELPKPTGRLIYNGSDQKIFCHEQGEDREHYFWLHTEPHMLYSETAEENDIYFKKSFAHTLEHQYLLFNAIAAEKLFLEHNALILHSSFIIHEDKAIVFTAPSGTGKSTQAALWERVNHAEIINGDRCLLQKRGEEWYACGLPICGSSDICKNKEAKLSAIVYLSQNPSNQISVIPPSQAARKIMSECTINFWNQNFVDRTIDLCSDLVQKVPMLHFACTKTDDAVTFLEREWKKLR